MSTQTFEGDNFVFYSNSQNSVTLKSIPGSKLLIDGLEALKVSGANTEIQYNDNGQLGASSSLSFNNFNKVLTTDHINDKTIFNQTDSDSVGYSNIYGVNNEPQVLKSSYITLFKNMGSDSVELSKNVNSALISCPVAGASGGGSAYVFGGMSLWEKSEDSFIENTSQIFTYMTYTNSAECKYSCINENGDVMLINDGSILQGGLQSKMTRWSRTGSIWSSTNPSGMNEVFYMKIYGNYLIYTTRKYGVKVSKWNGTTYVLQNTLKSDGVSDDFDYKSLYIHSEFCAFYFNNNIYFYVRSGEYWSTDEYSIERSGVLDFGIYYDGMNRITVCTTVNGLFIYKDEDLKSSWLGIGFSSVCTNGSYVFAKKNNTIEVYKFNGVSWARVQNSFPLMLVGKISCNDEYLLAARPGANSSYGDAYMFKIVDYINVALDINKITLNEENMKIEPLKKLYVTKDVEIIGDLYANTIYADNVVSSNLNNSRYKMASTVACFGDSITEIGLWPAMLAAKTGKTFINRGKSATTVDYPTYQANTYIGPVIVDSAYNNYSFIVAYGTNDSRATADLFKVNYLLEWYLVYQNLLITMAMKQENMIHGRDVSWTRSAGTWVDTPVNTWGLSTTTTNAYVEKSIYGRYYAFSFLSLSPITGYQWQIKADGVEVNMCQFKHLDSGVGNYYARVYIVDMLDSAFRNIRVINQMASSESAYFEYVAAWDENSSFRDVLCLGIGINGHYGANTNAHFNIFFNYMIERCVESCKNMGLPVFLCKGTDVSNFTDNLHFNKGAENSRVSDILKVSEL